MQNPNAIAEYIAELNRHYNTGHATEHTYRPALQRLLENLTSDADAIKNLAATKNLDATKSLSITNEPRRIACGAPDFIVTRGVIPVGYIEAKDIGTHLNDKAHQEQFDRYKESLGNLIITDYLTFQLFENGEPVASVTIGHVTQSGIEADPSHFQAFDTLIWRFTGYEGRGIQTSVQLSQVMAAKARLMAGTIENALNAEEIGNDYSLEGQLSGFRDVLIHDIAHKEFSDIYAQTIAYGMFAARLNDKTLDTFTRANAAQWIPQSNPFLRKLFQYIAGYDLDERIRWVVDDLANLFNHVAIHAIHREFGKTEHDPIIHFYETFLAEYDPALRKSRGVWFTPLPVVRFIVQAVDDILEQDFGLSQGLADASQVPVKQKAFHRVQILDPAAGTGTFLAEVVQKIYRRFKNRRGMWQSYAAEHLIPRINGFEILMASYAMAHLKLDMLLQQTGYRHLKNKRLRIFLTNSLEEARAKAEMLPFAQWLSDEANEANSIKKDVPVMVVLGNPPYSGESQNSGEWMDRLLNDYKKEPDSEEKLQERNAKWINDDYVKFIRLGQEFVNKNTEGVLAYINNHSYLDNPTFRGMRWNLLKTFDRIYILDLHGNAKKKETASDGGKDENMFDIQQGVCINIFVKSGHKANEALAEVFHDDLFGRREEKGDFLENNTLQTVKWKKLKPTAPYYFFKAKDFSGQRGYKKGFSVKELFPVNSVGIVTARDHFTVHFTKKQAMSVIKKFLSLDNETARERFELGKDVRDWSVLGARNDLTNHLDFSKIIKINYRPFDTRYTYYTGHTKGFHCMPRSNVMQHFLKGKNVGLAITRQTKMDFWGHIVVTDAPSTALFVEIKDNSNIFPLYLYHEEVLKNGKDRLLEIKTPNLNEAIINDMAQRLGLRFTDEKEETKKTFAPMDVLDYIYAVLHSPTYRERYKEFLKIDFPRVPYPEDVKTFRKLVKLGGKLRRLHLMEGVEPLPNLANYPVAGSDEVEKVHYAPTRKRQGGRVDINDTQYFDRVPSEAWEFTIGGYQPAQKWLKDRKGRKLNYDDIRHYQQIIRVLNETGQVMLEIDEMMV